MSGYDFLKSQVFIWWRKVVSDCDVIISSGKVFQTRGPATENARSPTVEHLTDVTIRRLVPPERNVRRLGRLATGTSAWYAFMCTNTSTLPADYDMNTNVLVRTWILSNVHHISRKIDWLKTIFIHSLICRPLWGLATTEDHFLCDFCSSYVQYLSGQDQNLPDIGYGHKDHKTH